ncbi:vacuolar ATP synthase subunit G [Theileria orientalis strain Shintoku]|uniref:Vacuolar ATP synthase subunit G n=1 Tax=Theileria orientalis strain Shintoku TaxID=869250 RepID=J4CDD0_THEOR|nr:vacuolar ATP synthase subunit G [Theileria orientalis strain Shintoku]PVC53272.1 vacuolar ATP synthase subunit G [Theileria orientalis]BAM40927.1 vacuolar ATP synthase subunit G [Theileria orientalis strain Shintoku]|eukprot:XP_009691228.1 vacuolar ATP synthase subunit G [Theileria orientalis strain Shintoku]
MNNSSGSNALIQQLLKAEEEAESIVRRAKENRVKLLNEAMAAADKDLEVFRQNEQKQLMEEYNNESALEDPRSLLLELRSQTFVDDCNIKLKELKPKLVEQLVKATLDIPI